MSQKKITRGRWVPVIDTIPIGEPSSGVIGSTTRLSAGRSYYAFSEGKPFDWYVFKFAFSWNTVNADLFVNLASMADEDAWMMRAGPLSGLVGSPAQAYGAPLPYTYGHIDKDQAKKVWALSLPLGEDGDLSLWFEKGKIDHSSFIAPFVVSQGDQLRVILQNKSTVTTYTDCLVSVVGARWLDWGGEVSALETKAAGGRG